MNKPERSAARERERQYRKRCRVGAALTPVPVTAEQRAGLVRLGLIDEADDRHSVGWAIGRLLDAAGALAEVGRALYPEDGGG